MTDTLNTVVIEKARAGFLDRLHDRLQPQFGRTWWKLAGQSVYLNPPALMPGIYNVTTGQSLEGFSPVMMLLLGSIQAAVMLFAIETKSRALFISLFLSVIITVLMLVIWALRVFLHIW